MNRDAIISTLYTGKNFNDCLSKMEPAHLRDDLKAEVMLIICEWPDEKVIKLHTDGVLEFYVARVIINQVQSNTSPFYKKYRQISMELNKDTPGAHVFEYGEVNGEIMNNAFRDRQSKRVSAMNAGNDDTDLEDRLTKEGLESVAMGIVEEWANSKDNSLHYRGNLIKLYMEVKTFRAMEQRTGIPFISCYKNIQQSIGMLKGMVMNRSVWSKEELRKIASGPKIKINL
jgi:hypothetical protein